MSRSIDCKAQTSFETIFIAGLIIVLCSYFGSTYFGAVSDQTTAVIILKTELLKALQDQNGNYIITGSLEPVLLQPSGVLCFEVTTRPTDAQISDAILLEIKKKIASKTGYADIDHPDKIGDKIEIKLNPAAGESC